MSKKTNTLLFMLGATVFNILVTILSFLLLLVIYSKFFFSRVPESVLPWALPLIFTASIIISFLAYRMMMKIIMKKVDLEKYLDPIFRRRK